MIRMESWVNGNQGASISFESMKEDVKSGMLMELEQYFSQVEATGSGGQKLAARLKELASQFDNKGILKVLEATEKN